MPKKRSFNFKQLQGSSSGKPSTDGNDGKPTVNERLGELRKIEGKDAARRKRELAENVNQRSVPPTLNTILGVPESAPPKPKRGIRTRIPNRTPGPAPPSSWLRRPAWSPIMALRGRRRRSGKSSLADDDRSRPAQLLRLAYLSGTEHDTNTSRGSPSLLHLALKAAAEQWELFDKDDLPALAAELPLRLRIRLLSYIGFYGPAISMSVLESMLGGDEAVTHLDLAGLVGHSNLTVSRLAKFSKTLPPKTQTKSSEDTVLDSWDQDDSLESELNRSLYISRFAQLTHLSVSHPPSGASWRDLLSLSKQTPALTHLSLAFWPRPTLTPNWATATVSSQHSPDVRAGGSHFYSGLDQDLDEPASILRQLSGNLLCLQWLDLEGCAEWIPALAVHAGRRSSDPPSADSWNRQSSASSIFISNWKNLSFLNCRQGWLPSIPGLKSLPLQSMPRERREVVQNYFKSFDPFELLKAQNAEVDVSGVDRRRAEIWLELEERVVATEQKINQIRRAHGCKPIVVDHGWTKKAF
ncbi:hypothetical protein TI39_contig4339g00001 [Zymoseptoria brevis]|uniref:Uncharacterized protein n=1 Tax=Zymoseptoria brevis TaxID=1047168 RepID=A0A0F4G7E7_9PEZI|nr:hypothetical protein TI39_contig4339g00001 [Zymoseptoria brevis]